MPERAPDGAEQQAVAEEDAHHAAVARAERLQDADVAVLLGHDHREDRQDAEPGDADDHEQQQVQDAALDVDGGQQRPLVLLPASRRGRPGEGNSFAQFARHERLVALVVLQLDLDRGAAVLMPRMRWSWSSGTYTKLWSYSLISVLR